MTLQKCLRAYVIKKSILSSLLLMVLGVSSMGFTQGLSDKEKIAKTNPSKAQHQWHTDGGLIVLVGSPYIELYRFPGRAYPRFHAIEKHEKIKIFKNRTDWYKIETLDGKVGWARRRHLHTLYSLEGQRLNFSTSEWSEHKNRWQLGLLGGRLEDAQSYSIFTGYRFTPNISTELRFTQTFGISSNAKQAHVMLVHQPFPRWRVTPFFALGAGIVKIYPNTTLRQVEDEQDPVVTVSTGLLGYLTHNVLLRLDYSNHTLLTTREQNEEVEEWKVGFSVLF